MAEKEYYRLTRTRPRSGFSVAIVGRSSLWLGKDHLLLVDTTGFTESYKRFYFRDIQAISFYRTARWNVWSGVFGGLAALCLLGGLATGENAGLISFGIIGGIFAVVLIVNLAMGPSCRCYLRTAVQNEELASVSRIGKARKILDRVRPLLAEAQGQLAPEEIAQKFRDSLVQAPSPAFSAAAETQAPVDDLNAPPRMVS
jgi:hypothetical protein